MILKVWRHASFECVIAKMEELGIINGYVGLPKGHPYFEISYQEIEKDNLIQIHGGLTFSGSGEVGTAGWPTPEHWYVGFDTGHSFDYKVNTSGSSLNVRDYKWSQDGVIRETNRLAKQMRRIPCKEELVLLRSRRVTNDY